MCCIASLLLCRWYYKTVSSLDLHSPITVDSNVTCADATKILTEHGIDQIPVVDKDGSVHGGMYTILFETLIKGHIGNPYTII